MWPLPIIETLRDTDFSALYAILFFSPEDDDYAESSSCLSSRNSLGSFIDFAPEYNTDRFVLPNESEAYHRKSEKYDAMRPRDFFRKFTRKHCGSQLRSSHFKKPFSGGVIDSTGLNQGKYPSTMNYENNIHLANNYQFGQQLVLTGNVPSVDGFYAVQNPPAAPIPVCPWQQPVSPYAPMNYQQISGPIRHQLTPTGNHFQQQTPHHPYGYNDPQIPFNRHQEFSSPAPHASAAYYPRYPQGSPQYR